MRQTPETMKELLVRVKNKLHLKSLVIALSAIVVFTTTYLLILPAFTLDKQEAADQGGIDVVAVETAAETAAEEEAAPEAKTDAAEAAADDQKAEEKAETKTDAKSDESGKTEKAEKSDKADVKLLTKKTTITAEKAKDDDFAVSAVVGKDAKVPQDVSITATELSNKTDEEKEIFAQYKKDALAALKEDSADVKAIKSIKLYDISLESDSQEDSVEPEAPVSVKIAYDEGMKVDNADNIRIVHFAAQKNGEEKAVVLDATENKVETTTNASGSKVTEASFDTDGFSTFAVVEVTLNTKVITADGETYTIDVTYDDSAKIPAGATLTATEIEQDSEEWQEYYKQTTDAMGEEVGPAYARFFDIKILADGKEIEPASPVQTKITYTEGINLMDGMEVKAVHFAEKETELLDVEYTATEENGASEFVFVQNSFSVTGVVTNTITSGSQYIVYMQSTSGNRYAMRHNRNTQQVTASGNNVGANVTSAADDVLWTFEATTGGYYIYYREGNTTYYLRDSNTQNDNTGTLTTTTNRNDSGTVWTYSNNRIRNTQNRQRYLQRDGGSYRTRRNENDASIIFLALYTPPTPVTLTVHYVNESGEEIHTTTTVPERTDSGVTAITDVVANISGYTYHNTFIGSQNGTQIVPEIRSNGGGAWSYQEYGQEEYTAFTEDSDIYVVYGDPYAASGSGGGSGGGGGDTPDIGTPQTSKDLVANGDGTYTLSLSITGKGKSGSSSNGANVIMILDTSNSMDTRDATDSEGHTVSRFNAAVEAAQSVSTNLLGLNTADNPELVEMCLVEFNWDVVTSGWYTNAGESGWDGSYPEGTFNRKIADATRNSGTNWEGALQAAIEAAQNHQDGDDTYIIFLTDGNPSAYTGTNGGQGRYQSGSESTTDTGSQYYYHISNNYMHATDEARQIVQDGYYFYTIGMYGNVDVLKNLTNFAYNGRSDTNNSGHYYPAAQTSQLVEALEGIADVIKNSLSLAGVTFEDGIATDTTHTALSTTVSGTPGGITYSKTGGTSPGYTVKVDNSGTPTFTVGGNSTTGTTATITYDKITGTTTTQETTATVYQATIGGNTYNMPMATIVNGELEWDLSPLETLEDQATYRISFVVWPEQEVYDYVANLNNGLADWDSSKQVPVTDDSGNVLYYKNGVEGHPNIVYYPAADVYAALTNTNQSVTYYVANTEESGGTSTTTYTEGDPIPLPNPDPMGLTSANSAIEKKWNVELQKTQLISYLFDTYTGASKEKSIEFTIKQDGEEYKKVTLGWDPDANGGAGAYVWADETETINYYGRDYVVGSLWAKDFAIANGIMLSSERMTALGLDTTKYPSGSYDGKTYYIIESGHDYDIEEPDIGSYRFDFETQTYHPMLVDGVLKSVNFTTSGNTADITYMTPESGELTSLRANNTLRGGINLNKVVVDQDDQEINPDTKFAFTLSIHNDKENLFTGEDTPWYAVNGNYYHDRAGNYISEDEAKELYGSKEQADAQGGNILQTESPYTDASATLSIKSTDHLRIANVPAGTTYTIVESDANGYELISIDKVIALSEQEQTTDSTGIDVDAGKVDGTIVANRENNITFTNKKTGSTVQLLKVDVNDETITLDDVTFDLYSDASHNNKVNTEPIITANGGLADLGLLSVGTYYLVETGTKPGYNKISSHVVINVYSDNVTYTQSDYQGGITQNATKQNDVYRITVRNGAGEELPMTGGIGTTIFYILGSLLVIGCGVVLVSRRRMGADK